MQRSFVKIVENMLASFSVLVLAIVVAWISHTQEPEGAFLFPRLISIAFVALAVLNMIADLLKKQCVTHSFGREAVKNLIPGFVIMTILVFFAAKALGFYVASTLAFFTIYSLYDHQSHKEIRSWAIRLVTTAVFMITIYGLFAMLLQVQTPRGIMF